MSEEKKQDFVKESNNETADTPQGVEITINRKTNEIVFTDAKGGQSVIKANIIDYDDDYDDDDEDEPLTPQEFRDALQRLDKLGLTWTADRIPSVTAKIKDADADSAFLSPEFEAIQQEYPQLPREVSAIAFHHFTGSEPLSEVIGNKEYQQEKLEIAKHFFLNDDYRAEFFFKHSVKVPYFSDIDWEVVLKLFEKNVRGVPAVAYALLTLKFDSSDKSEQHSVTVAADAILLEKLIRNLEVVKDTLEQTHKNIVNYKLDSMKEDKTNVDEIKEM